MLNGVLVNHHTYLRGPTSKGKIACVKRLSEIVIVEIYIPTDRWSYRRTNLNSVAGFEVPFLFTDVLGVKNYVVFNTLNRSKQPIGSSKLTDGNPKGRISQKQLECGMPRNMKVWGVRRIHSTTFICGKGSSKFKVGDAWFEGQVIKNQFKELIKNVKNKIKCNNLTVIMADKNFLIGCYFNIKSKSGNMTQSSISEPLDGINEQWLDKISNTFKNGEFHFKLSRKTYISKLSGKGRLLAVFSLRDKIVQEGMRIILECVYNEFFRKPFNVFRTRKECHTTLNQIRVHFKYAN